jgi:SAM-dependent methyltransferase
MLGDAMAADGAELDENTAAAKKYEDFFVPALFRQWASRVLDAAGVGAGDRVLDVACGTGVVAREAAVRVGLSGSVAGVDIGEGMLAVAEQLAPTIDWQNAPAEDLPFEDGSFAAVVSQFGLMFFTDRSKALREMMRVLAPGGRLAIAVWASLDRIPAVATEVEILERIGGADAGEALRAPFVLGDADTLRKLADEAGVASTHVEAHGGEARFPSVRSLVEADLRGWLPIMGVKLQEELIQEILDAADRELADYVDREGQMTFDMPALILSGAKPA